MKGSWRDVKNQPKVGSDARQVAQSLKAGEV